MNLPILWLVEIPMPSLLRSASLTNYVTVAREVGLDPHIERRRAAISAAALLDPDIRLPAEPVMQGLHGIVLTREAS